MSSYRKYDVTATPKSPAWDERDGWTVQVLAKSKSDAIKFARVQIRNAGHMGQITFRAAEAQG